MGKHVEQKRYLWGLIAALLYFMVYILISLMVKQDTPIHMMDYVKTLAIIAGSGMLGGMLS
jgi:putative membrane protein (TIGR04086 family)